MARLAVLLAFTVLMAACGQSGDLYLPDARPAPTAGQPQSPGATVPEDEKKKDAP